jgi:hypothetical protein
VFLIVGAVIVAAAVVWTGREVSRQLKLARDEASRQRAVQLLNIFAPGIDAAHSDPRALLTWQPLARAARRLAPDDFAALDRASGATFPFTADDIQAAHARWTAEWLAWEHTHDAEFRLKASAAEHDLTVSGGSPVMRAKLDAVEREKLDAYQRRYEEYVRVAKSLQALTSSL